MAYTPTTWEDRVVDRPRTYTIQNNADGTITLIPEPGVVHTAGTPVNSGNMNKIEQAIDVLDAAVEAGTAAIATKANSNKPQIVNPFFSKDSVGQQLRIGTWGDLSDNNAGHVMLANNAYSDAAGVIRYSNAHADLGAKGLRMAYGSRGLQFFDTGSVKTVAGQEFAPAWRNVALKNSFFIDSPHIDAGTVYLDNPDFFKQAGFEITFLPSITTTLTQVSTGQGAFPIVAGLGEFSIDVEPSKPYTIVFANNHFFLRSSGGGGGGSPASSGKLKLLASTIIPGHQIAGYNYAGQVVHAAINAQPNNTPTPIPTTNTYQYVLYRPETKKLNETTLLCTGLYGTGMTVLKRVNSQLTVVTTLAGDIGWVTVLDNTTFLVHFDQYSNPYFAVYKYNEAAGTLTQVGSNFISYTGTNGINGGNKGSSLLLDGNVVMCLNINANYRRLNVNPTTGAMSFVEAGWMTVSRGGGTLSTTGEKVSLRRSGNFIVGTSQYFMQYGSSYMCVFTFTLAGVAVAGSLTSVSISGLDWSSINTTQMLDIGGNYFAILCNAQYQVLCIVYVDPSTGVVKRIASNNLMISVPSGSPTYPRPVAFLTGVANGKVNGFFRVNTTTVRPFQVSYTTSGNPSGDPGTITVALGTDFTVSAPNQPDYAWPMDTPLVETPYGFLYINAGGVNKQAAYWYVPNALITSFAAVDPIKPIGIVTGYVAAGEVATIATKGLVKNIGGLAAGRFYYHAVEGWLTSDPNNNMITPTRMGYMITATTIYLLDNYLNMDTRIGDVYSDAQVDTTLSNAVAAGKAVIVSTSGVMSAFTGTGQPVGMSNGTKLVIKGIVKGLSGLYPSREYFLDASGNLTQNVTSRYVGIAISSTELLMSKDLFN